MAIEIAGSNSARAIRLSKPDRIVLDFPGAVPAVKNKNISVNSTEIKGIRVARFQQQPPVTRVVIDLSASYEFELSAAPSKLTVKLTGLSSPSSLASANAPSQQPRPEPVLSASVKPEAVPVPKETRGVEAAKMPVLSASAKPEATPMPKETRAVETTPAERASTAATTMGAGQAPVMQAAVLATAGPAQNLAAIQQQAAGSTAAVKPKYTGEPISINVRDVDLKDFFRLINEISGLNIVIDPNVKGSVSMVLNDVPWDQALDIVLRNNGLDRQLDGNVLRIAAVSTLKAEADARRAQVEAQAQAVERQTVTRFLSYARANDVSPTVKRFLTPRGEITADARTNSLIVSDIPSVIPEIDRLLAQLDRKTQQVEIEARVVAANRSYVRDLGVQLGFAWGNFGSNPTTIGGAPGVGSSPLTVTSATPPPYFVNGGSIPLFSNHPVSGATSGLSLSQLGATYRIDAILTMAENRGLVKILSRPRVVTQNNQQALVRQGVHVPVVTAAQLGGPPTTTYVDAFLKLSVTPQITVENTIFLSIDVENTTPDFSQGVNGNPALLTQQATTQVLVGDGQTVVIGGVIQTQNSTTVDQTPLLGDIPVLGNLFKRRQIKTSTNELIFFISPRIVQM
jgi:type IV pilus assembly protein PilQ